VTDFWRPTEPQLNVEPDLDSRASGLVDPGGLGMGRTHSATPTDGRSTKRGRFATNLAANIGVLVLSLLIALWYTPYLIHHLGVAAYGLIPLIVQVTGYLAILTLALNSAVGRWITIAIERREYDEANRYFNASFFGSLFLIAVLAAPAGFAASHVPRLISVPAGQELQARWLMGCAVTVFFLDALLTPFGVATYCTNRFDLQNLVVITDRIVPIGVVVVLFSLFTPRLWQVGLAMVAATLVSGGVSLRLWRKLTPMLRLSSSTFDIGAVFKLASFGGWIAVNQVGVVLFLAIDLLVVNRLFGPAAGGRYAAVMQWSSLLRLLAGTIAVVFGPTILYIYARNDPEGLVTYSLRATKFMGLLLALPIGLVCGFATPLLRTWLGPEFAGLAPLMFLMTIHLGVNLAVTPLFNIQTATNRVAVPGVVTLVTGAANLGLALLLAGPAGWGLYGVAAAGAIMLTAKNLVFTPVYAAHCLGRKSLAFFRPILRVVAMTVATSACCYGLTRLVSLSGWLRLGGAVVAVSFVYAATVLLTQVSGEERMLLWNAVRSAAVWGRGASDTAAGEASV
jgi:membrane protein EpsK